MRINAETNYGYVITKEVVENYFYDNNSLEEAVVEDYIFINGD